LLAQPRDQRQQLLNELLLLEQQLLQRLLLLRLLCVAGLRLHRVAISNTQAHACAGQFHCRNPWLLLHVLGVAGLLC
jgi:hypothetical protein